MKPVYIGTLSLFLVILLAGAPGCGREESTAARIKTYAAAFNLVKPAYAMMKDHHQQPELAGSMFTRYMKAHRDPLVETYKNYAAYYGEGKHLGEMEKRFLDRENEALAKIQNSPEILKLMADESFKKASREGFDILADAQSALGK
jgi:hypothetical protein